MMSLIALALAAVRAFASGASKTLSDVDKVLDTWSSMEDKALLRRERRRLLWVKRNISRALVGKGDALSLIESLRESANTEKGWCQLQQIFTWLAGLLEGPAKALERTSFRDAALAAESAIKAREASAIFLRLAALPAPTPNIDGEYDQLIEIGQGIRELRKLGIAALQKADLYLAGADVGSLSAPERRRVSLNR